MPRVEEIKYVEAYKLEMIKKLMSYKYVFISNHHKIQKLANYYSQYNLIETGEDNYSFLFGYIIRKSLNPFIKKKFGKL
jgi:hypothetical protein